MTIHSLKLNSRQDIINPDIILFFFFLFTTRWNFFFFVFFFSFPSCAYYNDRLNVKPFLKYLFCLSFSSFDWSLTLLFGIAVTRFEGRERKEAIEMCSTRFPITFSLWLLDDDGTKGSRLGSRSHFSNSWTDSNVLFFFGLKSLNLWNSVAHLFAFS